MIPLPSAVRRGTCVSLLIAAGLIVGGCTSDDRPSRAGGGNPTRTQILPTLTSRDAFFAGRILAEVRVGAMAGFDRSGDGEARGGDGRPAVRTTFHRAVSAPSGARQPRPSRSTSASPTPAPPRPIS